MELYEEKFKDAQRKLFVSDHIVNGTYPLLKDPKLLVGALENLHLAFISTISALLEYERLYKRIPPFSRGAESELVVFKTKVMQKYGFDQNIVKTYDKVRHTLHEHQTAPIEFRRNESFVIASNSYALTKISPDDLKKDIKTCREFMFLVEQRLKHA